MSLTPIQINEYIGRLLGSLTSAEGEVPEVSDDTIQSIASGIEPLSDEDIASVRSEFTRLTSPLTAPSILNVGRVRVRFTPQSWSKWQTIINQVQEGQLEGVLALQEPIPDGALELTDTETLKSFLQQALEIIKTRYEDVSDPFLDEKIEGKKEDHDLKADISCQLMEIINELGRRQANDPSISAFLRKLPVNRIFIWQDFWAGLSQLETLALTFENIAALKLIDQEADGYVFEFLCFTSGNFQSGEMVFWHKKMIDTEWGCGKPNMFLLDPLGTNTVVDHVPSFILVRILHRPDQTTKIIEQLNNEADEGRNPFLEHPNKWQLWERVALVNAQVREVLRTHASLSHIPPLIITRMETAAGYRDKIQKEKTFETARSWKDTSDDIGQFEELVRQTLEEHHRHYFDVYLDDPSRLAPLLNLAVFSKEGYQIYKNLGLHPAFLVLLMAPTITSKFPGYDLYFPKKEPEEGTGFVEERVPYGLAKIDGALHELIGPDERDILIRDGLTRLQQIVEPLPEEERGPLLNRLAKNAGIIQSKRLTSAEGKAILPATPDFTSYGAVEETGGGLGEEEGVVEDRFFLRGGEEMVEEEEQDVDPDEETAGDDNKDREAKSLALDNSGYHLVSPLSAGLSMHGAKSMKTGMVWKMVR